MQYYLNDKKLNKIEKQKAEKDGLKIFEELDDYALKGWEEMDEVDLQMRLKWYGLFFYLAIQILRDDLTSLL